jgi:hypothetical protein
MQTMQKESIKSIFSELKGLRAEMDALAVETQQRYLAVKASFAKPTIVGVITLAGGKREEYTSYGDYYNARAFYSKMGAIKLAIVGVEAPCRVVDKNHPQFMLTPSVGVAKAA